MAQFLTDTQINSIYELYIGYFNRAPEAGGLNYWSNYYLAQVNAGKADAAIQKDIANQFYSAAVQYNIYSAGAPVEDFIKASYLNALGRTSVDDAGMTYWTAKLTSGEVSRGEFVQKLISDAKGFASDATYGWVSKYLDNRMAVAKAFAAANTTTGDAAITAGKAALSAVTPAAVQAGQTTAEALAAAGFGGTSNEAAKEYVLTTNQDVLTGTTGDDFFRAVAGQPVNSQDETTLNSSDIIKGGSGNDTLIVNMTGPNYNGGARISGIETLKIGTNQAASAFDYNVNQGLNEISDVTTIVYDQINNGEVLTVNNILKTGDAVPTLKWDNEAGSRAGGIVANFRDSAVSGTTQVNLVLDDVIGRVDRAADGVITLASGVETLKVTSQGSGTNTLNNSANVPLNGGAVDLVSGAGNRTLTKVIVDGAQNFGQAATVITDSSLATYGQTNRATGVDGGVDQTANAIATSSNLISVAASVTEIDASAATGNVSMRFTPNTDGTAVNVTYKGGEAKDYIEFERGTINATGGKGDDTFAFITANFERGSFDSTDSIVGGEGSDAIQLGNNGAGNYVVSSTEFSNKSGIDTLDVRTNTANITLSDAFVAAADNGFTMRTDKVIQTSDTSSANPTVRTAGTNALEDNMATVANLTNLTRGMTYLGGSGSDRLVLNNASFNASMSLDGGANVGNNGANAAAGDYDLVTIQNSSVVDAGDMANVKGFEGFNLVETVTGNSAFNITMTEAFLLNNTASANSGATDIDDRLFQIFTAADAGGTALNAGDTVTVDITDMMTTATSGVLKTTLNNRTIDVSDLLSSGVTVQYMYNGALVANNSAAALAATGNTSTTAVAGAISASSTALNGTVGAAAGAVAGGGGAAPVATGNAFTLTAAGAVLTNAASNLVTPAATYLGAGSDTITAGINFLNGSLITDTTTTDADVLNATITGVNAAVINGIETINLQSFGGTLGLATVTGLTTLNVTGAGVTLNAAENKTTTIGSGFAGTLTQNVTTPTTQAVNVAVNGVTGNVNVTTNAQVGGTLALTATGTNALGVLTVDGADGGAGVINLTIGGTGSASITGIQDGGAANANTVLINASTNSGGVTYTAVAADDLTLTAGGTHQFSSAGDTVNLSALASFAGTVNLNAGNDTYTSALGGNSVIRGNAGNDIITLSAAAADAHDTIVFEATAATNGVDAINGFVTGSFAAATAGTDSQDALDFRAFVSGRAVDTAGTQQTGTGTVGMYTTASAGAVAVNNAVVFFDNSAGGAVATALTSTTLAAEFVAGQAFGAAVGQRTVVIEGNGGTAGTVNVWYVSDLNSNGAITADEVTLVGTLANVDVAAMVYDQIL